MLATPARIARQVIAGARALGEEALAEAVAKEKDWRHKYNAHMYKLSEAQARSALPRCLIAEHPQERRAIVMW